MNAVEQGIEVLLGLKHRYVVLSASLENSDVTDGNVVITDRHGEMLAVMPRASWDSVHEQARTMGLNCQKRRPEPDRRMCPLGKGHLGDCEYPARTP